MAQCRRPSSTPLASSPGLPRHQNAAASITILRASALAAFAFAVGAVADAFAPPAAPTTRRRISRRGRGCGRDRDVAGTGTAPRSGPSTRCCEGDGLGLASSSRGRYSAGDGWEDERGSRSFDGRDPRYYYYYSDDDDDDDSGDDLRDDYFNERRSGRRRGSERRRRFEDDDDEEEMDAFDDGLFRLDDIADGRRSPSSSRRGGGRGEGPRHRYSPVGDFGRYPDNEYDAYGYEDEEEYYDRYDEPRWDWEDHPSGASVLLPPPSSSSRAPPSSVIHFVGGTFFGSYPRTYYGPFLESLARRTNSAVVATPIPVTLRGDPLDHLALGRKVWRDFVRIYGEVLLDEYGFDDEGYGRFDTNALSAVPVVGLGHSLGARILAVLDTNPDLRARPVRRRRRPPQLIEAAEDILCSRVRDPDGNEGGRGGGINKAGNVLVGFCNYGAVYSIPGVGSLRRGLAKEEADEEEREDEEEERRRRKARAGRDRCRAEPRRRAGRSRRDRSGNDEDDEFYYDDSDDYRDFRDRDDGLNRRPGRRRQSRRGGGRRPSDDGRGRGRRDLADDYLDEDYYDYDEDEYDDFLTAMGNELQSVTSSIRSALTSSIPVSPSSGEGGAALEFSPPPEKLWSDIGRRYGSEVGKTLVVQFDRDRIDQGGKLARCIVERSADGEESNRLDAAAASGKGEKEKYSSQGEKADVKFARLPGSHLTPVTYTNSALSVVARSLSSLTFDDPAVRSALRDRSKRNAGRRGDRSGNGGGGSNEDNELDDLVRCVGSYIEEVICAKAPPEATAAAPVSSNIPSSAVDGTAAVSTRSPDVPREREVGTRPEDDSNDGEGRTAAAAVKATSASGERRAGDGRPSADAGEEEPSAAA